MWFNVHIYSRKLLTSHMYIPCEEVLGKVEDLMAGLVGFVSALRLTTYL